MSFPNYSSWASFFRKLEMLKITQPAGREKWHHIITLGEMKKTGRLAQWEFELFPLLNEVDSKANFLLLVEHNSHKHWAIHQHFALSLSSLRCLKQCSRVQGRFSEVVLDMWLWNQAGIHPLSCLSLPSDVRQAHTVWGPERRLWLGLDNNIVHTLSSQKVDVRMCSEINGWKRLHARSSKIRDYCSWRLCDGVRVGVGNGGGQAGRNHGSRAWQVCIYSFVMLYPCSSCLYFVACFWFFCGNPQLRV